MDSVDALRRWMADYSRQLRTVKMPGALPESTQKEFDKFVVWSSHYFTEFFLQCFVVCYML